MEAFVGDDPTYGKGHVGLDVFLKVFRFTLGQSLRLLGKASESEMAKAAERDEKRGNASTIIQVCLFEKDVAAPMLQSAQLNHTNRRHCEENSRERRASS